MPRATASYSEVASTGTSCAIRVLTPGRTRHIWTPQHPVYNRYSPSVRLFAFPISFEKKLSQIPLGYSRNCFLIVQPRPGPSYRAFFISATSWASGTVFGGCDKCPGFTRAAEVSANYSGDDPLFCIHWCQKVSLGPAVQ